VVPGIAHVAMSHPDSYVSVRQSLYKLQRVDVEAVHMVVEIDTYSAIVVEIREQ
jgi:hypothetical protein